METTRYLFNDQPVQIIARENAREVWIETSTGDLRRVYKAGLATQPRRTVALASLRIDNTRGTDGAR